MIQQTVLPFKFEVTRDTITAPAGLALLGEFCMGFDLPAVIDRCSPTAGSGLRYVAREYAMTKMEQARNLQQKTLMKKLDESVFY